MNCLKNYPHLRHIPGSWLIPWTPRDFQMSVSALLPLTTQQPLSNEFQGLLGTQLSYHLTGRVRVVISHVMSFPATWTWSLCVKDSQLHSFFDLFARSPPELLCTFYAFKYSIYVEFNLILISRLIFTELLSSNILASMVQPYLDPLLNWEFMNSDFLILSFLFCSLAGILL